MSFLSTYGIHISHRGFNGSGPGWHFVSAWHLRESKVPFERRRNDRKFIFRPFAKVFCERVLQRWDIKVACSPEPLVVDVTSGASCNNADHTPVFLDMLILLTPFSYNDFNRNN
jgi:hypothetical protein